MKFKLLKMAPTLVAASLISTTGYAADATLTVGGSIVPAACDLTLGSAGVVNYPDMVASSSLNPSAVTPLTPTDLQYRLSCSGSVIVSLSATDNRTGTSTSQETSKFGLGLDHSQNRIGNFEVRMQNYPAGDGRDLVMVESSNGNDWTWAVSGSYQYAKLGSVGFVSWTDRVNGPMEPSPISEVNGTMTIAPTIAPTDDLDTSHVINMDGAVTLLLHYI